ncbi:putative holin-like toxin [Lapidilactobacillus wuchangensis]|nr:putative holin-like toxin [Lapidilactobacillus wuchangensis]
MSIYETLQLMISFGMLILAIITITDYRKK